MGPKAPAGKEKNWLATVPGKGYFARSLGDRLVVGLNSDASVLHLKGPTRPILPVDERRELLLALESVDQMIVFDEPTPLLLIESRRPDVLVKVPDYAGRECCGAKLVESYGGRVVRYGLDRAKRSGAIWSLPAWPQPK